MRSCRNPNGHRKPQTARPIHTGKGEAKSGMRVFSYNKLFIQRAMASSAEAGLEQRGFGAPVQSNSRLRDGPDPG